jgi:glycosyltransferase involved in cell wall biosynthesis
MRVLLATAYFDSHRGGIELVAGRLAQELVARGVAVSWLATDATPPQADATAGQAIAVAAWNVTEQRLGVPFPLPGPGAIRSIWRAVRETDVVLLHDSLYPTNIVTMLAARRFSKPVVLVQHIAAVPYTNPVLRRLMQLANAVIARPMLAAADQVVFISDTVARHFASVRFKAPPRLIFNGVDTAVFRLPPASFDRSAALAQQGLPSDRPVVLFVGRFVEKKGLHIIERLARRRPDLTFALAGWGVIDPQSWQLPNVRVLSGLQASSLVPLYQASDVFVLPSIGEGLPLVMQEALACGLPVICGAETASADPAAGAIVHGIEINSADPDQTAAVAAVRLDQILAASADRTTAAAARHAYVRDHYSWTEAAKAYHGLMAGLRR